MSLPFSDLASPVFALDQPIFGVSVGLWLQESKRTSFPGIGLLQVRKQVASAVLTIPLSG